jgi:hypothetical protein
MLESLSCEYSYCTSISCFGCCFIRDKNKNLMPLVQSDALLAHNKHRSQEVHPCLRSTKMIPPGMLSSVIQDRDCFCSSEHRLPRVVVAVYRLEFASLEQYNGDYELPKHSI